jgi:hypothetical protein
MKTKLSKQAAVSRGRRQGAGARSKVFKPHGFSFKREAKWMTVINLAPFGIGVILALIFWFTR